MAKVRMHARFFQDVSMSKVSVYVVKVLSAATLIAKHTSSLCNTCRMASSKTANPVAKRHFVQSAKDVANSTANLVRAIKVTLLLLPCL